MSDTPDQTPPAAAAADRAPATKSHGRLSVRASLTPRDLMEEPLQVKSAWRAKIITLMPDAFPGILGQSLTGKALDLGLWALDILNLRPYGVGKHLNVDDTPSGGGAGMVLRADVLDAALTDAAAGTPQDRLRWPLIYLSPRGKPFNQAMARRFAACDGLTLLCGRFEGVDQRLLDHHQIEEVSLGDFVLTGGEIPAMALIDATVRLLPKVLGNEPEHRSRNPSPTACWNTRTTPAPPNGRAAPSPKCSPPATTQPSPNGARARPKRSPNSAAPTSGKPTCAPNPDAKSCCRLSSWRKYPRRRPQTSAITPLTPQAPQPIGRLSGG